jgi:prolyl-tRNA editing enzyme YbaK/EbsC (Cys-tRNA(Pro) deacylase)
MLGSLDWTPANERPDLLAPAVASALTNLGSGPDQVLVAEIDPDLADTTSFCDTYGVPLEASANCVVVVGKRGGTTRMAACVVLATTRADVNNAVRRRLDARKASFAPMDLAVTKTGMAYGGITPVGLPDHWPLLVDSAVVDTERVVVGSGLRRSKLLLPGALLAELPNADVIDGLGKPLPG